MTVAKKFGLSVASLALLPGIAMAAEMCVKCSDPDASYDCVLNGANSADTVAKLYCITALAKVGPHGSCAIDRNSVSPCQGERKEFTIPASTDGVWGDAPQHDAATDTLRPQDRASPGPDAEHPHGEPPPEQAASDAPPKTVQEMVEKGSVSAGLAETQKTAGNAAKSAGTALEKAGSAVGSAAKTSWKCLSSFFSNC